MPTRPRLLLVHANPFQRVAPVPPYGLERVRTAAAAAGAETRIVDPYLFHDEPREAAARIAREFEPDVIGLGIRIVDDCVTISRLDAPPDEPTDLTWFVPEIRRLRDALVEAAPGALLLAGGAAFSYFPQECLDELEVEHGVAGAGEDAVAELVRRLAAGAPIDGIPGLVRRGEAGSAHVHAATASSLGRPTERDARYSGAMSFPVRTRAGCAMQCVYCLTANLRRAHADVPADAVLAEIESLVADADARGIARVPVFFADDELNLPNERHAVALLQGILERGLAGRIGWRGYFNPTPFSAELADLVARTNGQVSLTVDSVAEPVLVRAQKPFRRPHLDATLALLLERDVRTTIGFIFGLPGETHETVAETLDYIRALPPEVRVVYSAGARVYPHTPLAAIAAAEPERVVGGGGPSFFAPAVYSSPLPPRELARLLADELGGLPNVEPISIAYRDASHALSRAYRVAVDGGDREAWQQVLDESAGPLPGQGAPQERLLNVLQLAQWHERFDLAALVCRQLARLDVLPAGLPRWRLHALRLLFRCRQLAARA